MSSASIRSDFKETDYRQARALITWNALVEPGDRIAGELLGTYGPVKALEVFLTRASTDAQVTQAFERWAPRYSSALADEKIALAARYGMKLLLPTDAYWPKALVDLGFHAPTLLWYRGALENFQKINRALGVVGSRNATQYGQRVTSDLAVMAVQEGATVISGGALGIDSVAHRTTLQLRGLTTAIMAGALDSLYPAANGQLFDEIGQSGLLISEMTPNARPTRWRFLQRNRLIAALSQAIVVTEAGWRSGSINTVNHAGELGRPVFAVPGPISNPASAGCNRLIREGKATLLLEVSELPAELNWRSESDETNEVFGSLELRALDSLTSKEQDLQTLLIDSGLDIGELRIALGSLRLMGRAELGLKGGWKRSETR